MNHRLRSYKHLLQRFAQAHHLHQDWHTSTSQDVTAVVTGRHLDNSLEEHQFLLQPQDQELVVHVFVKDKEALAINLATLLAVAAATE